MSLAEAFPWTFWLLMGAALVVSALGFYKFIYFISLGYGFTIAVQGLVLLILYRRSLTLGAAVLCLLLTFYGCRLGGYLLNRERKSAAYRKTMETEIKDGSGVKLGAKLGTWVGCALLYTLQVSPIYFRLQSGAEMDVPACWGLVIMAIGLLLEAVADRQKSAAKAKDPSRFCDTGVYRLVRCPNYLGEVLFWTGVLVSGVMALEGVWQWIAAILGWVCIVYIMFGGARRLEIRQNRNYGEDPEYQAYVRFTPILIPFLPLYSVEKYKFLVG